MLFLQHFFAAGGDVCGIGGHDFTRNLVHLKVESVSAENGGESEEQKLHDVHVELNGCKCIPERERAMAKGCFDFE